MNDWGRKNHMRNILMTFFNNIHAYFIDKQLHGIEWFFISVICPTVGNITCLGPNHCQLRAVKCRTIDRRTIKHYSDI